MVRARRPMAAALLLVGVTAVAFPLFRRAGDGPVGAADLEDDLRARATGPIVVGRAGDDDRARFVGSTTGGIDVGGDDPAGTFVDTYGPLFGLTAPGIDLAPIATVPSLGGGTATRFQQVVDGVPVLGGQVSVQVDADGLVRSSLADVSPRAGLDPPDLDPTVTPAEARSTALIAAGRATGAAPDDLLATEPRTWIYDPEVVGPPSAVAASLVWRVEVTGPAVRQLVLVDAHRGGVALNVSELAHGLERRVCDAENTRQAEPCVAPYARTEGQGATGLIEVDRVYDYSGATYDFFATRFGRDGIADDGAPVVSKVRFCSTDTKKTCPYDNAFWNGSQLTFGDGFARADDVVAHELTHGVTEHTANLFYWYQSGAINESMSDVFGELVDLTDGLGNDTAGVRWELGEDLPGGALRDMADPAAFGDPDRMTSAAYHGATSDGGGVHTNSGVGNRAAVLITDGGTVGGHPAVTGIGVDKAAAVYYEALTTLLVSGSDYADLAVALPQACANLAAGGTAGLTTADCDQVQAAVVATEMATVPPNAPASEAPVCPAGEDPTYLFRDDLEDQATGNWAFQTPLGPYRWAYEPTPIYEYATSGIQNFWGPDTGATSDRSIVQTTSIPVPAGSTPYLRFRHAYGFEFSGGSFWDGGVVEYSTDDGGSWTDLGPRFDTNGYDATLVPTGTNPLRGQAAFGGQSRGYLSSRANLTSLAGQSVRFRFRIGEDELVGTPYGWFVDDIDLYTCTAPPNPSLAVDYDADRADVVVGDDIDLQVTVENTGNVALSGVVVDAAVVDDCDAMVGALAVAASTTIDCTYTTTTTGPFEDVATADADQLTAPVTDPVSVTVADPAPALDADFVADQATVDAGDAIDLHLTLHNTGNVVLTGLVVTEPDCGGPVADLDPDASVVVDCSHQTAPTDQGTYTTSAIVDSDQLDPITSPEVAVLVERAALEATVDVDVTTVVAGDTVDLLVDVTNVGNVDLTGVTLTAPACDPGVVPAAIDTGTATTLTCTMATGADDVPAFALVGAIGPTVTVDSAQTAPVDAALDSPIEVTIPHHTFTDGAPWADEAISWLTFHGIADGLADGTFRPGEDITRGQVVRMIWRLAGEPAAPTPGCGTDQFRDVPPWVHDAIDWVTCDPDGTGTQVPLMAGFANGTFRSGDPITRAQVVRMVWRFAGEAAAPTPGCGTDQFRDVPPWVHDAVDWATCDPDGTGTQVPLMAGFANGTFRPNDPINRAQVARLFLRTALLLDL